MLIPVGAKHLETTYLRRGAHMASYARTDIVVTDMHKTYGLRGVVGQTVGTHSFGQLVDGDVLEAYRQVIVYQLIHAPLYLLLLLPRGLVVESEAHFAFFPLHMGIERPFTPEKAYHGLVKEMFSRMGRWELLLMMFVEDNIVGHVG